MTDKHFKRWIDNKVSDGVVAFKILSYETLGDTGKEYNPLDEDLMDASNVSCNFNYIETLLNLDSKTFMASIKKENYKQNECWINSITDFLGDTLMNTNKKRNVLTRDKLLAILNKTEDTVKLGISVKKRCFTLLYALQTCLKSVLCVWEDDLPPRPRNKQQ